MLNCVSFICINIILPIILTVVYSVNTRKYGRQYSLTKAVWYLCYASVVTWDYLINEMTRYVAGFTVTLAIMEGVPCLIAAFFEKDL